MRHWPTRRRASPSLTMARLELAQWLAAARRCCTTNCRMQVPIANALTLTPVAGVYICMAMRMCNSLNLWFDQICTVRPQRRCLRPKRNPLPSSWPRSRRRADSDCSSHSPPWNGPSTNWRKRPPCRQVRCRNSCACCVCCISFELVATDVTCGTRCSTITWQTFSRQSVTMENTLQGRR